MNDLNKRHDEIVGIVALVHILHQALVNNRGSVALRSKGGDGAVVVVADLVERRNVNALDFCAALKKLRLADALSLALAENLHYLEVDLLSLADEKDIHEIRNRFGVAGAGSAGYDYIFQLCSVARINRHVAQPEHIEHIGVAKLVLQSKTDKIKIRDGVAALEGIKRYLILAHQLLHVDPRRKNTLAPDVIDEIEAAVEYFHAEVRHSDLVCIGKAKGKAHVHIAFVLDDLV